MSADPTGPGGFGGHQYVEQVPGAGSGSGVPGPAGGSRRCQGGTERGGRTSQDIRHHSPRHLRLCWSVGVSVTFV